MAKYIVPIITSFYEYYEVEAASVDEAVAKVKDGDGEEHCAPEFREVIDVMDDMVEEYTKAFLGEDKDA